jgi:hypothetical protein
MWCKAVKPSHSVQLKLRLTESGTDLITILSCFLSFKTVATSRNIIVFKTHFPCRKTVVRVVHALKYILPLDDKGFNEIKPFSWAGWQDLLLFFSSCAPRPTF